jgi:hypothetical protein
LILLLLHLFPGTDAAAGKTRRVPDGVWGGEHIGLWVERGGARVEYDCGRGTIDQPLVLDRHGRFNVKGTHYKEHGGPVRIDEENNGQTARYTGALLARTLTITITLPKTGQTLGTFRLKHTQEPHLVKCLSPR